MNNEKTASTDCVQEPVKVQEQAQEPVKVQEQAQEQEPEKDDGFTTIIGRRNRKKKAARPDPEVKPQRSQGQGQRSQDQGQRSQGQGQRSQGQGQRSQGQGQRSQGQRSQGQGQRSQGPRPDQAEYKQALKQAERIAAEELHLPDSFEDDVIEARYTLDSRTGGARRNWRMRTDKVLFATLGDGVYSDRAVPLTPTKKEGEESADEVVVAVETVVPPKTKAKAKAKDKKATTSKDGRGDDRDREQRVERPQLDFRRPVSDTIVVGTHKFSRKRFYANRFFNKTLSEYYDKRWGYGSYLRRFTDRRTGDEIWNLELYWN